MVRELRFCYLFILALALSAPALAQHNFDAFVLRRSGKWKVGQEVLRPGEGLHSGDVVRLDTGSTKRGTIAILYRNGHMASCPDQERPKCLDLPVLPQVRQTTTVLARVFNLLQDAFSSDSQSVPGLSKSAAIPDGYAELRGTELLIKTPGLASNFSKLSFRLQFRRMDRAGHAGVPIAVQSRWHPGSPIDAPHVKPGFYRVNLLDADSRPTGDFFMLLVFDAGSGGHVEGDFKTLVATTGAWGEQEQGAALEARRLFLWQSARKMGLIMEN